MNSQEAINENFIPYPYNFPAIKFVVEEEPIMDKIVAVVTAPNPMYTHIILGSMGLYENSAEGDRYEYFTRAGIYMPGGGWAEFSGHYNMTLTEALKDLSERIARGY